MSSTSPPTAWASPRTATSCSTELPYRTDYLRAVGGSGMHWMGLCLRLHPDDLATRTRYGYGRDWPIGYEALEPYYAAAEREIGVAGDAEEQRALGIPSDPRYVYPMHKIPPSYVDEVCRSLDGRTTWALAPAGGGQIGPFRGPGSTSGWEAFRFGDARRARTVSDRDRQLGLGLGHGSADEQRGHRAGRRRRLSRKHRPGSRVRAKAAPRPGRSDRPPAPAPVRHGAARRARQPGDDRRPVARRDGKPAPGDLSDHVKEGMAAARYIASVIYGELGAQEHTDHSPRDGVAPLGYFRYRDRDYSYEGAGHGAGTHLMGGDPASSVVDSFQRCWDHRNLYAVGCGSMASVGTSNPSLTMAALALRSAEQIHRNLVELHRPANLSGAEARP